MKLVTVVGARPQFVKAAAITHAIDAHNAAGPGTAIGEVLVHTGQHYDHEMSTVFFEELDLPDPDHHLGVGSATHGAQTGRMLEAIESVLVDEEPDVVVVHGDTNSTLAGALAATKLHLPVAHVEAGLRSFDRRMPEEVNRVVTDHVSDLLFCPSDVATKNLANEGITNGVHVVGDVMQDMVQRYQADATSHEPILKEHGLTPGGYALATVHRASNTDDASTLQAIMGALDELAGGDLPVILPLHPRTKNALRQHDVEPENVTLTDPVSYVTMLGLERDARVILTDSGGVQKEAYWAGVPCVTMRDETEWTETVDEGWNTLVGADRDAIVNAATAAKPGRTDRTTYGRGEAGAQIVAALHEHDEATTN